MSFLRSLSDKQILSKINELVSSERSLTRGVLLHLNEIERRRLHLKLGYASMFDYCTTGLGYSSSAAARRIRTARCIARYPEVLALLKANDVNLSTVSQVSRVLTPDKKTSLLQRIRGKSQREVEAIIAEFEPRSMPQDRVRPIFVSVPSTGSAASELPLAGAQPLVVVPDTELPAEGKPSEDNPLEEAHCRSGSDPSQPLTEKRMQISFSASEEFMAKLEQIKSLAWHRLPANPTLEQVFELAMDYFIDSEDPVARRERRETRKGRSRNATTPKQRSSLKQQPRRIAAAVKDEVFARDNGRCTYTANNGRRCASTRGLQIDHVQPVARGGGGTRENLRVLCAYHNRLEAERVLGFGEKQGR